jgi:hypothetical protein
MYMFTVDTLLRRCMPLMRPPPASTALIPLLTNSCQQSPCLSYVLDGHCLCFSGHTPEEKKRLGLMASAMYATTTGPYIRGLVTILVVGKTGTVKLGQVRALYVCTNVPIINTLTDRH